MKFSFLYNAMKFLKKEIEKMPRLTKKTLSRLVDDDEKFSSESSNSNRDASNDSSSSTSEDSSSSSATSSSSSSRGKKNQSIVSSKSSRQFSSASDNVLQEDEIPPEGIEDEKDTIIKQYEIPPVRIVEGAETETLYEPIIPGIDLDKIELLSIDVSNIINAITPVPLIKKPNIQKARKELEELVKDFRSLKQQITDLVYTDYVNAKSDDVRENIRSNIRETITRIKTIYRKLKNAFIFFAELYAMWSMSQQTKRDEDDDDEKKKKKPKGPPPGGDKKNGDYPPSGPPPGKKPPTVIITPPKVVPSPETKTVEKQPETTVEPQRPKTPVVAHKDDEDTPWYKNPLILASLAGGTALGIGALAKYFKKQPSAAQQTVPQPPTPSYTVFPYVHGMQTRFQTDQPPFSPQHVFSSPRGSPHEVALTTSVARQPLFSTSPPSSSVILIPPSPRTKTQQEQKIAQRKSPSPTTMESLFSQPELYRRFSGPPAPLPKSTQVEQLLVKTKAQTPPGTKSLLPISPKTPTVLPRVEIVPGEYALTLTGKKKGSTPPKERFLQIPPSLLLSPQSPRRGAAEVTYSPPAATTEVSSFQLQEVVPSYSPPPNIPVISTPMQQQQALVQTPSISSTTPQEVEELLNHLKNRIRRDIPQYLNNVHSLSDRLNLTEQPRTKIYFFPLKVEILCQRPFHHNPFIAYSLAVTSMLDMLKPIRTEQKIDLLSLFGNFIGTTLWSFSISPSTDESANVQFARADLDHLKYDDSSLSRRSPSPSGSEEIHKNMLTWFYDVFKSCLQKYLNALLQIKSNLTPRQPTSVRMHQAQNKIWKSHQETKSIISAIENLSKGITNFNTQRQKFFIDFKPTNEQFTEKRVILFLWGMLENFSALAKLGNTTIYSFIDELTTGGKASPILTPVIFELKKLFSCKNTDIPGPNHIQINDALSIWGIVNVIVEDEITVLLELIVNNYTWNEENLSMLYSAHATFASHFYPLMEVFMLYGFTLNLRRTDNFNRTKITPNASVLFADSLHVLNLLFSALEHITFSTDEEIASGEFSHKATDFLKQILLFDSKKNLHPSIGFQASSYIMPIDTNIAEIPVQWGSTSQFSDKNRFSRFWNGKIIPLLQSSLGQVDGESEKMTLALYKKTRRVCRAAFGNTNSSIISISSFFGVALHFLDVNAKDLASAMLDVKPAWIKKQWQQLLAEHGDGILRESGSIIFGKGKFNKYIDAKFTTNDFRHVVAKGITFCASLFVLFCLERNKHEQKIRNVIRNPKSLEKFNAMLKFLMFSDESKNFVGNAKTAFSAGGGWASRLGSKIAGLAKKGAMALGKGAAKVGTTLAKGIGKAGMAVGESLLTTAAGVGSAVASAKLMEKLSGGQIDENEALKLTLQQNLAPGGQFVPMGIRDARQPFLSDPQTLQQQQQAAAAANVSSSGFGGGSEPRYFVDPQTGIITDQYGRPYAEYVQATRGGEPSAAEEVPMETTSASAGKFTEKPQKSSPLKMIEEDTRRRHTKKSSPRYSDTSSGLFVTKHKRSNSILKRPNAKRVRSKSPVTFARRLTHIAKY